MVVLLFYPHGSEKADFSAATLPLTRGGFDLSLTLGANFWGALRRKPFFGPRPEAWQNIMAEGFH